MSKTKVSTEEKILAAAEKVFVAKGYAAARTRDIALEAGINTALLNYYFRSKEKLLQEVMKIKIEQLAKILTPAFMDEKTSLKKKVKQIADAYQTILVENPKLPLFIVNEMERNNLGFLNGIPLKKALSDSAIVRQIREANPKTNPLHLLLNLISTCVFPFIAQPILIKLGLLNSSEFDIFINERKEIIYKWFNTIINA